MELLSECIVVGHVSLAESESRSAIYTTGYSHLHKYLFVWQQVLYSVIQVAATDMICHPVFGRSVGFKKAPIDIRRQFQETGWCVMDSHILSSVASSSSSAPSSIMYRQINGESTLPVFVHY